MTQQINLAHIITQVWLKFLYLAGMIDNQEDRKKMTHNSAETFKTITYCTNEQQKPQVQSTTAYVTFVATYAKNTQKTLSKQIHLS